MNSHKKHEIYHANGVKAQKGKVSTRDICRERLARSDGNGTEWNGNIWKSSFRVFSVFRGFSFLFLRSSCRAVVQQRRMRSFAVNQSSSKKGVAIVELALAMLLMMSMILFSVFVCRAMSERNRSLAASRTVAWLYSHADDPDGDDDKWDGDPFNKKLRAWHFTPSRHVEVTIEKGEGLMSEEANKGLMEAFVEASKQKQTDVEADVEAQGKPEDKPEGWDAYEEDTSGENEDGLSFGSFLATFTSSAVKFLTQGFKYCNATVISSVPLTFGVGFYQLFGWFNDGTSEHTQAKMQNTFVSSCFMPMQSGGDGVADPFKALVDLMDKIRETLEKLMKEIEIGLYRPYKNNPRDQMDKTAFQALLMYEIYDPGHEQLKTPDNWYELDDKLTGVSDGNWAGNSVTFNKASEFKTLLDQCKANKYTGNY